MSLILFNLAPVMKTSVFILLLLAVIACNPVKQAFKPKHIEKTKEEFFRRNLCIVDTQYETKTIHDSVVYKDTIKLLEFKSVAPKSVNIDTTINGSRIKIVNGSVSIELKEKVKTEYRTNLVTKTLRDLGYENTLKKTIAAKDSVFLQTKTELTDVKAKYYKYKSIVISLIVVVLALVVWRLFTIFKV
jgi:hypothetical protein